MARCPKLDSKNGCGLFSTPTYFCELTGIEVDEDSAKFRFVCKADSGYAYEECPVYKNR